jgi:putative ABC transport system ATP-binding protein
MLSGILAPSSGKVLLDGTDIYSLNDDKRSMLRSHCFGFLPQGQNALYSLTVLENVLAPYTLHGAKAWQEVSCEDAMAYAMFLLEQANIAQLADIMPAELSGGEIRRMAIARALIRKPAILFADEPTGDLDPENTRTVLTLFRTLADQGMTVFLVSHDTEALEYADHTCRMKDGILTGGSHD